MRRKNSAGRKTADRGRLGHYVYIAECSDGSLYTGYTTDPRRRLAEHNAGSASRYTRTRRPVKFVYLEELAARGAALSREFQVKKMKKDEKLLLVRGYAGREKPSSR